jgi:hypothetical protein
MPRQSKFKFAIYKVTDFEQCINHLINKGCTRIPCRDHSYSLFVKTIAPFPKWIKPLKNLALNPNELQLRSQSL